MTNFTALVDKLQAKVLLVNMEGATGDFVARVGHKLDVHPRIKFTHQSIQASFADPQALIEAIRSHQAEIVVLCGIDPENNTLPNFMEQLAQRNPTGASFVLQLTKANDALDARLNLHHSVTIVSRHRHVGDSNPTRTASAIAETVMQRLEPKRETSSGAWR